jgi:hypothetical protein
MGFVAVTYSLVRHGFVYTGGVSLYAAEYFICTPRLCFFEKNSEEFYRYIADEIYRYITGNFTGI